MSHLPSGYIVVSHARYPATFRKVKGYSFSVQIAHEDTLKRPPSWELVMEHIYRGTGNSYEEALANAVASIPEHHRELVH